MPTSEGVRFSDRNQEIEPDENDERGVMSPEMERELRELSVNMQKSRLQASRLENFAFEPVSLPPSRVPSPSGHRPQSSHPSPHIAPGRAGSSGGIHPLTPADTKSNDGHLGPSYGAASNLTGVQPSTITPQRSPGQERRRRSGPSSGSIPGSRDVSPLGTPPSSGPGSPHVGPVMDANERYARSQRAAQGLDPRTLASKRPSYTFPEVQVQRPSVAGSVEQPKENKSHGLFGSKRLHSEEDTQERKGSMQDLKRFFHLGSNKNKDKSDTDSKKSTKSNSSSKSSGFKTPPNQSRQPSMVIPFADDHGLQGKYGRFGKVLGSGAGGSVRLMKRSSDGVTFAVKQFRARHTYETEKEYNKKVTAEFCIGSTLHHGNVIETMDIIQEKGNWYEVMEYAPFDLFATVMTGKMSKDEVTCCTMQILNGVAYLHSMGLAHRDLKLDNVVISEHGIMKLIDFGSAAVFRYPFEDAVVEATGGVDIHLASNQRQLIMSTGIVGSDPYLAPEVYDNKKYDPQAVDIWSLAIIYCCMSLRRFPWKAPRVSDVSYKLFVAETTPGAPPPEVLRRPSGGASTAPDVMSRDESMTAPDVRPNQKDKAGQTSAEANAHRKDMQAGTVKGPWRLLRLLPRESRHIVGRMLELDPEKRATLEDIYRDNWVARASVCRQEEGGRVIRAPGHTHTLEPGAPQPDKP